MTLKTYYADGDIYYGSSVNWVNGCIANTVDYTYNVDGTVDTITETVDGSDIVTAFSYNLDGTVDEIVETRDGKTITTSFTYTGGVLQSTGRIVA